MYRKANGSGIKEFVLGKDSLPNSVLKVLEHIGNHKIKTLKVCRVPIRDAFDKALYVATLGKSTQLKKDVHIDKLFHLFLDIHTENGEHYSLEKNEIIQMLPNPEKPNTECLSITLPRRVTVSQLLNNAIKMVGPSIYHYDFEINNCQKFLTDVLQANWLLTDKLNKFINQDIHSIASHIPSVLKFMTNKILSLSERLRYLTGEGKTLDDNIDLVNKYISLLRHMEYRTKTKFI